MIVLTTPTGNIGSKVLGALASTGQHLRLIVRDSAKLPVDLSDTVEVIQGRTDDPDTLIRAFTGARALFWCQPDTPTAEDYLKTYDAGSRTALEVVEATGVSHIVAISGAGAAPEVPAGAVTGLHLIEKNLSQSQANIRFLRCGTFFSNLLLEWEEIQKNGTFSYPMPGDARIPQVATEDIAGVASRLLLDPTWTGREAVSLLGPSDLSFHEIAAELTRQLGKSIRYQQFPADAYRDLSIQSGLSPSGAQGLVDVYDYVANHYREEPHVDRSLTPTTFAEWLSSQPALAQIPSKLKSFGA